MTLEPVIGLEIHVQLKTATKMFCGCRNLSEEVEANTAICAVCTGQPGALPVANAKSLELGVKTALALQATMNETVRFDRKNYFYPDLPKGYQITQYHRPIGQKGQLTFFLDGQPTTVKIDRLHLEEDAAKLIHQADATLIDFNRAGAPLLEIVTGPDFRSPKAARAFLEELKLTVRSLGVSDADMEKGQLRVDANISLRPKGDDKLYPKTEVKNLNSFRALERALKLEIQRQRTAWQACQPPSEATTRGWDEAKGETVERREKEAVHDYRYFPEPDLPPIRLTPEFLERVKGSLRELPMAKRQRFVEQYGFTPADANLLVQDKELADFAEQVVSEFKGWVEAEKPRDRGVTWHLHKQAIAKLMANWLVNRFVPATIRAGQSVPGKVTAENFAEFLTYVFAEEVSSTAAQQVIEAMVATGADPSNIIEERGLKQVRDQASLTAIVTIVLKENPAIVEQYKKGKTQVLQFLIGRVMKATKGTADPKRVSELIVHELK